MLSQNGFYEAEFSDKNIIQDKMTVGGWSGL